MSCPVVHVHVNVHVRFAPPTNTAPNTQPLLSLSMPPVPKLATPKGADSEKSKAKKKKSPAKKLAVKANYGGVAFGTQEEEDGEVPVEDDPLATYRKAAAVAAAAVEKERKDEAQRALFRKIFATMDTDKDGRVSLGEMVEAVAAGTAPLSHRAAQQSARPDGAIPLRLPLIFNLSEWEVEMRRVASSMDEATFQVWGSHAHRLAGHRTMPLTPKAFVGVPMTATLARRQMSWGSSLASPRCKKTRRQRALLPRRRRGRRMQLPSNSS